MILLPIRTTADLILQTAGLSESDGICRKKKNPRTAGFSIGEDKVFLYLSHHRSFGGIKCSGIVIVYPHSSRIYKKCFEKYVYMSYTM